MMKVFLCKIFNISIWIDLGYILPIDLSMAGHKIPKIELPNETKIFGNLVFINLVFGMVFGIFCFFRIIIF